MSVLQLVMPGKDTMFKNIGNKLEMTWACRMQLPYIIMLFLIFG